MNYNKQNVTAQSCHEKFLDAKAPRRPRGINDGMAPYTSIALIEHCVDPRFHFLNKPWQPWRLGVKNLFILGLSSYKKTTSYTYFQ